MPFYYKTKIYTKRLIIFIMLCTMTINIVLPISVSASEPQSIMGETIATKEEMLEYYKENSLTSYPEKYTEKDTDIEGLLHIIMEESKAEGVRADVVFAQILEETDWLTFNSEVDIEQNNFGGLKDEEGNYLSFDSIEEGIRANIQLLKGYASSVPLNQDKITFLYDLINPKGKIIHVEDLGKENWSENLEYGENIKQHLVEMINIETTPTPGAISEIPLQIPHCKEELDTLAKIEEPQEIELAVLRETKLELPSESEPDDIASTEVKTLTIDGLGYVGGSHRIRSSGTSENGVLYQFWVKDLSTNKWTMIQDYSKSSAPWTPTKAGKYLYGVHIKDEKSNAKLEAHLYQEITIKDIPVEIKTLTIDGSSYVGGSHRIRSYGESANGVLYQFWVKDLSANKWTMIQDYSKTSSPWTPTKAGKYLYGVHIKDVKSNAKSDAHLYQEITIKDKPIEVKTLTIDGTGCVGDSHRIRSYGKSTNGVLYQFWIKDLSTNKWTMIKDYSKSSALWTPTKAGKYIYGVHIKDEKSNARLETHLYKEVAINSVVVKSLNIKGSGYVGGTHSISSYGDSIDGVLYQFWVKDLSANKWTMIQDFRENNNLKWTPTNPGKYLYGVHIKDKESVVKLDAYLYKEVTIKPRAKLNNLTIKTNSKQKNQYTIKANGESANGLLYQFWVNDLSKNKWIMVQDYSEKGTYDWIQGKEGNYKLGVHIKDKKSPNRLDEYQYKDIIINLQQPSILKEFNIDGSTLTGCNHVLEADGTSVNILLYQFWIKDLCDNKWTMIQDYSENDSATWTPKKPGEYLYGVHVKDKYSFQRYDTYSYEKINIKSMKDYNINKLSYIDLPYVYDNTVSLEINYNVDQDGIPIYVVDGQTHYHPVVIAQKILPLLDGYEKTNNLEYLERAEMYANKLYEVGVKESDKIFYPYTFDFNLHGRSKNKLEAPWYSGMAQGQVLSVFSRLYTITEEEKYLDWARQTYNTLKPDGESLIKPWVVKYDEEGYLWFEEYPHDAGTKALNGFVFAIYGVYDYYLVSSSEEVKELLQASITTIERYINDYRSEGEISYYCLEHKVQSERYHIIHINQLEMLYRITGEYYFQEMANNFRSDYFK